MGSTGSAVQPSRLRAADTVRVAVAGLSTRPLRAVLSALGIAVGIAAMVAVVGISASSREQVAEQLRELGTNLLTAGPGSSFSGAAAQLPDDSVAMVARMDQVDSVSAVGTMDDLAVYRSDEIDEGRTNAIAVSAARTDLLATVGGEVESGRWLDDALADFPAVVLGATTAALLGISHTDGTVLVYLGGQWFTVVGILKPVALAPELDTSAMVGWPVASERLGFDGAPTMVYTRSADEAVEDVRNLLAAQVNPEAPSEVSVSRPSDVLAAQAAADQTLTTLLLALGGVALLVGGIGVANTMVIAVLERRSEVGLRRALGATHAHIRRQFLGESILLAGLGGIGGAMLGGAATAAFAAVRDWPVALPAWVLVGASAATALVGALAGVYPAIRAAKLPPTSALGGG
jgi:putative ABC transport system permease protein